jgi:hypothetical protein
MRRIEDVLTTLYSNLGVIEPGLIDGWAGSDGQCPETIYARKARLDG